MRIVAEGIVCAGVAGGSRAVATFPSLTVLPDGTVLAVYRIGATKDSGGAVTEIRRSLDGGASWSGPESPFASSFGGVRGSLQVVWSDCAAAQRTADHQRRDKQAVSRWREVEAACGAKRVGG
jgi:hypothetical protein